MLSRLFYFKQTRAIKATNVFRWFSSGDTKMLPPWDRKQTSLTLPDENKVVDATYDASTLEAHKHPFHVLTESKIPPVNTSYKPILVSPFFTAGDLQFVSTNLMILFFIVILVGLMLS